MGASERCDCGSGEAYTLCCGPYLAGDARPAQPEQLMRSRYTAFCRQDVDYLIATLHPSQRKPDDRKLLTETGGETEWLSLRVLTASPVRGNAGTVEFVVYYRHQGKVAQMREQSNFVREAGRWYYVDGLRLPPLSMGRNDPCWCGSGKKLKQCHGR